MENLTEKAGKVRKIAIGAAVSAVFGGLCIGIPSMIEAFEDSDQIGLLFTGLLEIAGAVVIAVILYTLISSIALIMEELDWVKYYVLRQPQQEAAEAAEAQPLASAVGASAFIENPEPESPMNDIAAVVEFSSSDTMVHCPKCGQKKLVNATLLQKQYYICSGCNEKIGVVRR